MYNGNFPIKPEMYGAISPDIVNYIDCPGEPTQTQVCAATFGDANDGSKWIVFLDGQSINFNSSPKFVK